MLWFACSKKEGPANALTKHRRKGRKKKEINTHTNRSSSQRIKAPGPCLRTRRLPPGPLTSSRRLGTRAPARREPRSSRGDPAGPAPLAHAPAAPRRRDRIGRRGPPEACGSQLNTAGGWDVCTPGRGASLAHKAGQEIKSQARPPPPKQRLRAQAWPCLRKIKQKPKVSRLADPSRLQTPAGSNALTGPGRFSPQFPPVAFSVFGSRSLHRQLLMRSPSLRPYW